MKTTLLLIAFIFAITTISCNPDESEPEPLPSSIDYRENNCFTVVKDQGNLGSCWAFACIGLTEYYIKKNLDIDVDLSEQHLVNCAGFGPQHGLDYLVEYGVTIEDSLPYQAQVLECMNDINPIYKISDYKFINLSDLSSSEKIKTLKTSLHKKGPFITHLDLYDDLGEYQSGIYEYNGTANSAGGHIIVVVGYNTDSEIKGGGYWICRNSWGPDWGENGYFRIPFDEVNIAKFYAYEINDVSKINTIVKLPVSGYHCRWSNDGEHIAYVRRNNAGIKLYVYNLLTNEEDLIVGDMDGDMQLSWLDDGKEIVFDAYDSHSRLDLWKVNIETGNTEFLIDNALIPDAHYSQDLLVCSQNERLTLFNKSGNFVQYIGSQTGGLAAISPDGQKVAYVSGESENEDIYTINIDGSNLQQITSQQGRDYWPRWSPDGNLIAFESERSGNFDIWTYNFTNQKFTQLTNHSADDRMGDWSPDGKSIVFISKRDGDWGMYILTF